jgi:hypothetical protein
MVYHMMTSVLINEATEVRVIGECSVNSEGGGERKGKGDVICGTCSEGIHLG